MQLGTDWLKRQGDDAPLLHVVDTAFFIDTPDRVGIAVSGGGDSMALLHLYARWSDKTGHEIEAVTVDHGLRSQSADEAADVQVFCQNRGIPHTTLKWQGWDGQGNLSAAARDARYALMADWAKSRGIGGIALGHTRDDVAESFLMRLGRRAGVDGLAAMRPQFTRHDLLWARPLWQQGREELRDYLRRHDVTWVDDPTNDDPAYTRTLARQALVALEPLGIDRKTLHNISHNLAMTRATLEHYTRQEADRLDVARGGDVVLPLNTALPQEIERRLASKAIQWIGGADYPARSVAIKLIDLSMPDARAQTVSGCVLTPHDGTLRISRELNSVKDTICPTDQIWDRRWRLDGPHNADLEIRALGDAITDCPDWRDSGVPRRSLLASPAVFRGDELIAAPIAGHNQGWSAQIVAKFQTFLLSH
jgi:tRNA(Ile)-lysidine synthase